MSYDFPDDFDFEKWEHQMRCDAAYKAFEVVGALVGLKHLSYAKGFSDGTLLREFCEDYTPEAYFPMADSRPTADRRAWTRVSAET